MPIHTRRERKKKGLKRGKGGRITKVKGRKRSKR